MTAELIDSHSRELGSTHEEHRAETVAHLEAFLDSQHPEDPSNSFTSYMEGASKFFGIPVTVERSDGTIEDEGWTISGVAHKDTLVENSKRAGGRGLHFEEGQEPFHMVNVLKANGFDEKGNPLSIQKVVPIELLKSWQEAGVSATAPSGNSTESSPIYDQLRAEQASTPEQGDDTREVSSTGAALVRSAQRINALLERRAINKAHGEALKEYRNRDHSDYVDHLASLKDSEEATPMARATAEMALDSEYRKADREEMIEKAKSKVRGFGTSALSRLKNAGRLTIALPGAAAGAALNGAKRANEAMGDAVMKGFEKTEAGMDAVGNKIADMKATVKENYQTYKFNRETEAALEASRKEYAEQVKALDKKAKSEAKLQAKVDKWESKFAAKEDRRFERSMRKKAAEERRAARRQRWADRAAAIKEAIVSAPEKAGDAMMAGFGKLEDGMDRVGARMVGATEAVSDKVERSKASVQATRAAGRAALEAFKTTRQTHTEQNKLY